ncbi:MAG: ChbG/HpnK family deacetylase [Bacteroidota bacterium]
MINLIINADDFGLSDRFNASILDLLERGQITSTTVMVNRISDSQTGSLERLKKLQNTVDISVGLHVEFTYDQHLEQVQRQFEKFVHLFGQKPTHLDIHKEHLHTAYHEIVAAFCKEQQIPFRNHGSNYPDVKMPHSKFFFGSIADFKPIEEWFAGLESERYYELVFHPGVYDPTCPSSLNKEREKDLEHIAHIYQNLKQYNIQLTNFKNLP